MSAYGRTRTNVLFDSFYWLGVAMSASCVAVVLGGNSDALWQFEHVGVPVSWVLGAIAMTAFLATEFCPLPSEVSTDLEYELGASDMEAVEI